MTPLTLTRQQVRRVDQRAVEEYGMSGLVLMENAGRGVADRLCWILEGEEVPEGDSPIFAARKLGQSPAARKLGQSPIAICCGKGNNAGDGFVIARHLDLRGLPVRVLLWAKPAELAGDAAANFHILEKTDIPIEIFGNHHDAARLDQCLAGAAWIVDGLLGTGSRGEPRPPLDAVIDQLNASGIPILAIDLPSGLDCDTGAAARHTIRAVVTCTFVAAKPGFFAPGAAQYVGRLHVLDIGVPRKLIDEVLG